MLIILIVLITWFTHSLRIEAAPFSHSLSYLFEVNTYHHRHHHDHHPHHQRNDDDQVRDAHSQRSIRNVTTTEPKVALVDLPPSSDFVILVRWGDDMIMMVMMIRMVMTDMEFVKNFTPPDFQAKNFIPSISPNFNSFSKKKRKK